MQDERFSFEARLPNQAENVSWYHLKKYSSSIYKPWFKVGIG